MRSLEESRKIIARTIMELAGVSPNTTTSGQVDSYKNLSDRLLGHTLATRLCSLANDEDAVIKVAELERLANFARRNGWSNEDVFERLMIPGNELLSGNYELFEDAPKAKAGRYQPEPSTTPLPLIILRTGAPTKKTLRKLEFLPRSPADKVVTLVEKAENGAIGFSQLLNQMLDIAFGQTGNEKIADIVNMRLSDEGFYEFIQKYLDGKKIIFADTESLFLTARTLEMVRRGPEKPKDIGAVLAMFEEVADRCDIKTEQRTILRDRITELWQKKRATVLE